MTAQEWDRRMRVLQLAVSVVCICLVATWAWSIGITTRLTKCEVQMSAVVEDIKEIKAGQKDIRKRQIEMLQFLQSRSEGK